MLRPFQHLRTQLLLAALLPVLILSAILSLPLLQLRHSQLIAQANLRAVQASTGVEQLLVDRVSFGELLVGMLAGRAALTAPLQEQDRAALTTFVQEARANSPFDLLTVLDDQGALQAQDGETTLWRRPDDLDAPIMVWSNATPSLVVQVAMPVLMQSGRIGTLLGAFAFNQDFLVAARTRTGLEQSLLLNGLVVTSSLPRRAAFAPGRLALADADRSTPDEPASGEATLDGVPYLARYQAVQTRAGEQVVEVEVLLPLTPVWQSQRRASLVVLAGALVAGAAGAALSWLLARQSARALGQLGVAAQRIGAGDLAAAVQVDGPRELAVLGAAIDQMRVQLAFGHAALAAETARYLNILDSTRDAILVLSRAERVELINAAAEQLLGVQRDRVARAPLATVVRLHDGDPLTLARISSTGETHLAIQTSDGRVRTVAATRMQIRAEAGSGAGEQIVVLRDVSDAVALDALKEAFLANVTHEFRTPLAAVLASLEILRDAQSELSPAEQSQMLDTVQLGVRRLDTLVQNLLDSASIQAGYFRVQLELTRLEPLVEEAVALMRPLLRQRAQEVQVALAPDLPSVLADDQRIVQVLVNLLSNASKFGPRGDRIQLSVTAPGDHVLVAVTDHGPGIPESRQPSLFERFLRPGSATVRAQGVGLGLAVVKAILERHGQQITVATAAAHGTTFRFTLEAAPVEAAARDGR